MLERTTIVLFLSASITPLAAQQGFQFGVKYIPTAAWFLNEDDAGTSDSRSAFGFGVNYHFNDGTGAGLDFIWSTENQSIEKDGAVWDHELSFFKLPVLLLFGSGSGDVVPFLGYVGIEYVKLREAHTTVNGVDAEGLKLTDVDGNVLGTIRSEDLFRSTNLGAVIGFGPGWNINPKLQLTAIARVDYLFHDPENKDAAFYWGGERPKTTLFTLGLDLGLKLIIGTGGG